MDQKKTLWIIAAVGAFLLVVLGAALILYSPEKKQATLASIANEKTIEQPSGWTNAPSLNAPNQQIALPSQGNPVETPEMIVFSDNTTVVGMGENLPAEQTTFDLNTLKQENALDQYAQANQNPQTPAQNINITVNLPETNVNLNQTEQKVISHDYAVTQIQEQKPARNYEPKEEKKPSKHVEAPKPAVTVSTKTTAKTSTTTVTTTVNTVKPVTQYWVQVAAYSNKKGAETARSVLDENKIPADVFTYQDNKSRLFYRVRVGPYTTKSEAEYWRTKIIKISEFSKAESYITSTTN